MEKLDIIMFCLHDKWQDWETYGFYSRSAILARKLSNHPQVRRLIVVNTPTSIAKVMAQTISQKNTVRLGIRAEEISESLTIIDHVRLLPRERLNPIAFHINRIIHDKSLIRFIEDYKQKIGCKSPVLWFNGPLFGHLIGKLNESLVVYDAVDDWLAHKTLRWMQYIIRRNYVTLQEHAHLVFTVSQSLYDKFHNERAAARLVPNGVDIDRFAGKLEAMPKDICHLQRPLIGYVGALQDRIDVKTVEELALAMPTASIVFVGPVFEPDHFDSLRKMENVFFVGAKHTRDVPAYLKSFDVCIMPHIENKLTRSMDPVKLYEYIAAGKPVVASALPGLERMRHVVYFAKDTQEFIKLVSRALEPEDGNTLRERLAFASDCSWDNRINYIMSCIFEALG